MLALLGASGSSRISPVRAAADVRQPLVPATDTFISRRMTDASMAPTIKKDDFLVVDVSEYDSSLPERGDVIAFMPPVRSPASMVRRIIAIPGDTVAIKDGRMYVNDHVLFFIWIHPNYSLALAAYQFIVNGKPLDAKQANAMPRSRWMAPDRLPSGCYFVVADDTNNAADSHSFGCVELQGRLSSGPRAGERIDVVGHVVRSSKEFVARPVAEHIYGAIIAPDDDMAPRFHKGDTLLIDTSEYDEGDIYRGSTIAFKPPIRDVAISIKRVIGYPGDTLAFKDGIAEANGKWHFEWFHPKYEFAIANYQFLVNGKPLDPNTANIPPRSRWTAPDRLPTDCYFVVGENSNDSPDSHTYGCAEFRGTFAAGERRGESTHIYGEPIKPIPKTPALKTVVLRPPGENLGPD
jgi:signal peptidase I